LSRSKCRPIICSTVNNRAKKLLEGCNKLETGYINFGKDGVIQAGKLFGNIKSAFSDNMELGV